MNFKSLLGTASLALLIGTASAGAQQISIGHLEDLSGGTADVGTPYGQGVVDTFAWVNKNGGIGGKQLAVDSNDYGYKVPQAIALYKKWSAPDNKVAAIMGWGTNDTEALISFVAKDQVPYISGSYAWSLTDPALAEQRLERLASELERTWPDAAGSLREGLAETLTLMRLGIDGQLAKTLCSTNPCESMIEIVRHTQRNVKRWQDGDMRKRWTAAGMLVAEQQFRRIIGYRHLAKLVIAIERRAARLNHRADTTATHTQVPEAVTV